MKIQYHFDGLDDFAKEIEALIATGMSHRQIADKLKISKSGVASRLKPVIDDPINDIQHQVAIGGLLGDSSLIRYKEHRQNKESTVYSLCFGHSEKQLSYLEHKKSLMSCDVKISKRKADRNGYGNALPFYSFRFHHKKYLTIVEKLCYKHGKKFVSPEWLEQLNPLGIAVWYMDDGHCSRVGNKNRNGQYVTKTIRLATDSFSHEELDNIINYFKAKWSINFSKIRRRGVQCCLECRSSNAEKFMDIVKPHLVLDKTWH